MLTVNVTDLIEESLKIDDGTAQRSVIWATFEVSFDRLLTVAAGAFAVNKRDAGGGAVTVGFTTGCLRRRKDGGHVDLFRDFRGCEWYLIDGNYDLTIDATKVCGQDPGWGLRLVRRQFPVVRLRITWTSVRRCRRVIGMARSTPLPHWLGIRRCGVSCLLRQRFGRRCRRYGRGPPEFRTMRDTSGH